MKLGNQLLSRHGEQLEDKSLTICSGTDYININYQHVICPSAEIAKVSRKYESKSRGEEKAFLCLFISESRSCWWMDLCKMFWWSIENWRCLAQGREVSDAWVTFLMINLWLISMSRVARVTCLLCFYRNIKSQMSKLSVEPGAFWNLSVFDLNRQVSKASFLLPNWHARCTNPAQAKTSNRSIFPHISTRWKMPNQTLA